MGNFPKFMYHPTRAPVQVNSIEKQLELGPEWSETYIPQAYPKWKFHWNKPDQLVTNAEEEAKLGGGWADTPAAFTSYRDPARARPQHPDPLRWITDWVVPGLSPNHREKLKAQLLKADATFWKAPDGPSATVDSMRLAFNGTARVLLEAEILTEQLLEFDIPLLVWDSAIAGGWWHLASEEPKDIFPEHLGHYWVWREESECGPALFRAETARWKAELLEAPARRTGPGGPGSTGVYGSTSAHGTVQRNSARRRSSSRNSKLLTEYKVRKRIRTHDLVAEDLGLERSVYFSLKRGKKVSEETYIKAALGLGCSTDDLKA
jgi:hypothetical protein